MDKSFQSGVQESVFSEAFPNDTNPTDRKKFGSNSKKDSIVLLPSGNLLQLAIENGHL